MIFVKLTEPVTKIYPGPGLTQTVVSGSFLTAAVNEYVLGQATSSFYFKIGDAELDDSGSIVSFNPFIKEHIKLTSAELADWGTDDFAALEAVAGKLNLEVESQISAPNLTFTL